MSLNNYTVDTLRITSCDIVDERSRQNDKWGVQRHSWPEWITVLTEEVGEAAQEACKTHWGDGSHLPRLRQELVQVAAVAVAIIEHIDECPGPERYYVDEREEGWAVFDRQTGAPVSHPVIHKPYVDLKCERMNQARREILAPTPAPAGDTYQYVDHGDGTAQVAWSAAPAGDDAATWSDVASAAYNAMYDAAGPGWDRSIWIRGVQAAVAMAITLGLVVSPEELQRQRENVAWLTREKTIAELGLADPPGARRVEIGDEFRDAAIDLREASYDALNNHKFETEREKKSFDRMCGAILRFNDAERALAAHDAPQEGK